MKLAVTSKRDLQKMNGQQKKVFVEKPFQSGP